MPTRPGKRLKAESRLFSVRNVIKSLSRQKFTNLDLQVDALNLQLENLQQLVQKYTTPVDDEYPVLSEADKIELSKAYAQSIAQCEHVLSFSNNKEVKDITSYKAMTKMAEQTRKFLTSDLRALTSLNAKIGATLPEALEGARTAVINLDTSNVQLAKGGLTSSRMPISISTKSGHKIDGMFTKTTNYDIAGKSNAIFQKLIDKSSTKGAKDFWAMHMITEKDVTTNSPSLQNKIAFYRAMEKDEIDWYQALGYLGNPYLLNNIVLFPSEEEVNDIKSYLIDAKKDISKLCHEYSMNTSGLRMAGGANIDERNTAMSIVANLFGRSDLLANSVSMTIKSGGVEQTGTFMEFVKGASDVSHLKKDDPLLDCNIQTGIDGRPVLKDMADLQVIDYICGNIDRHAGNMLYILDKDSKGTTYLKGIKGIDNDTSFATRNLQSGLARLSDINGMKVISESTAELVSKASPATLALALRGSKLFKGMKPKLSDEEIKRAQGRLKDLKEAIKNGTLEIVKDEDWKYKKIGNLMKTNVDEMKYTGFGVFSIVGLQFSRDVRRKKKAEVMKNSPDPGIKLTEAEMKDGGKGYKLDKAQQIKAKDGIDKVVQELDAVKNVWFGSDKYKNMLASAQAMQTTLAAWQKQSNETGAAVWDSDKFEKMANDLREKTELYLERKYAQSASKANRDNSIKRILAASSAMDFTHKFIDKVELSVWDEYRQNNAEYNMGEFVKKRQQKKQINQDVKDPELNNKSKSGNEKEDLNKSNEFVL